MAEGRDHFTLCLLTKLMAIKDIKHRACRCNFFWHDISMLVVCETVVLQGKPSPIYMSFRCKPTTGLIWFSTVTSFPDVRLLFDQQFFHCHSTSSPSFISYHIKTRLHGFPLSSSNHLPKLVWMLLIQPLLHPSHPPPQFKLSKGSLWLKIAIFFLTFCCLLLILNKIPLRPAQVTTTFLYLIPEERVRVF